MASSEYKPIKVYLHRTRDKDLIKYITDLPPFLRQNFLKEGLAFYRNHLQAGGAAAAHVPVSGQSASSAEESRPLKTFKV